MASNVSKRAFIIIASIFFEQSYVHNQYTDASNHILLPMLPPGACLSFGPMTQCVVHALKGLACRARVTPASSHASHCKQGSALTSTRAAAPVLLAHAEVTKNIILFSMGPKLRYPAVLPMLLMWCSKTYRRRNECHETAASCHNQISIELDVMALSSQAARSACHANQ